MQGKGNASEEVKALAARFELQEEVIGQLKSEIAALKTQCEMLKVNTESISGYTDTLKTRIYDCKAEIKKLQDAASKPSVPTPAPAPTPAPRPLPPPPQCPGVGVPALFRAETREWQVPINAGDKWVDVPMLNKDLELDKPALITCTCNGHIRGPDTNPSHFAYFSFFANKAPIHNATVSKGRACDVFGTYCVSGLQKGMCGALSFTQTSILDPGVYLVSLRAYTNNDTFLLEGCSVSFLVTMLN